MARAVVTRFTPVATLTSREIVPTDITVKTERIVMIPITIRSSSSVKPRAASSSSSGVPRSDCA